MSALLIQHDLLCPSQSLWGCLRQNSLKLRSPEDLTPESQRRLTFFAVSLAWPFLLKLPEERSF